MAYITFAIVALFFCLNMPRMILGSYEVSNTWLILRCVENKVKYLSTLEFYKWDSISRLLMVINSSINFLIYCMGSEQFKVSKSLLHKFCHLCNFISFSTPLILILHGVLVCHKEGLCEVYIFMSYQRHYP